MVHYPLVKMNNQMVQHFASHKDHPIKLPNPNQLVQIDKMVFLTHVQMGSFILDSLVKKTWIIVVCVWCHSQGQRIDVNFDLCECSKTTHP